MTKEQQDILAEALLENLIFDGKPQDHMVPDLAILQDSYSVSSQEVCNVIRLENYVPGSDGNVNSPLSPGNYSNTASPHSPGNYSNIASPHNPGNYPNALSPQTYSDCPSIDSTVPAHLDLLVAPQHAVISFYSRPQAECDYVSLLIDEDSLVDDEVEFKLLKDVTNELPVLGSDFLAGGLHQ